MSLEGDSQQVYTLIDVFVVDRYIELLLSGSQRQSPRVLAWRELFI